jgi:hypothetical protein
VLGALARIRSHARAFAWRNNSSRAKDDRKNGAGRASRGRDALFAGSRASRCTLRIALMTGERRMSLMLVFNLRLHPGGEFVFNEFGMEEP